MAATPSSFRVIFPEFANMLRYPDPLIEFWMGVAAKLVNPERWGDLTELGIMLHTAHNVSLQAQAAKSAAFNKNPGAAAGILSSKSVDGVSAGYDTATASEQDAGNWNLTTYGARYIRMARMMGLGPVQVGVETGAGGPAAWPGPYIA